MLCYDTLHYVMSCYAIMDQMFRELNRHMSVEVTLILVYSGKDRTTFCLRVTKYMNIQKEKLLGI